MEYTYHYTSPLGEITLACAGDRLTGLWFANQKYYEKTLEREHEEKHLPIFDETSRWLDQYFSGKIPDFTPPLFLKGTSFRRSVWEILLTIPYGETITYGKIAEIIAQRKCIAHMSSQAVGGAVGHNPISLIIPCHRVIGTDGSLTGYAGGLERKRWLLTFEKSVIEINSGTLTN